MPVLSDSTSGTTRLNTQLLNHSTNTFTFDKWIDKGPKKAALLNTGPTNNLWLKNKSKAQNLNSSSENINFPFTGGYK